METGSSFVHVRRCATSCYRLLPVMGPSRATRNKAEREIALLINARHLSTSVGVARLP